MHATVQLGLFVCAAAVVGSVRGHGTNDAFSSTEIIKQLHEAEESLGDLLGRFIHREEVRLGNIKRVAQELEEFAKIEEAVEMHTDLHCMEHPVNAFHLLTRWSNLMDANVNLHNFNEFLDLVGTRTLQVPAYADVVATAAAILRLQRFYELDTSELVRGKVLGVNSTKTLSWEECFLLGEVALMNKDYGLALQWLEFAGATTGSAVNYLATAPSHVLYKKAIAQRGVGLLRDAVATLLDIDSFHAENHTIKNLMYEYQRERLRLGKSYQPKHDEYSWKPDISRKQLTFQRLCRGDKLSQPAGQEHYLRCRLRPGKLPYVTYKEEVLNIDPYVALIYDVINDDDAEEIISAAAVRLHCPPLDHDSAHLMDGTHVKIAWLWDPESEVFHTERTKKVTKKMSLRLADLTGLDTTYCKEHSGSEPLMAVNYGPAGYDAPHVDYAEDPRALEDVPDYIQGSGDRIATIRLQLNEVKAGGNMVFNRIGVRVPLVSKSAVFWYNTDVYGVRDPLTEHGDCPVLLGDKWVANKFVREVRQIHTRPCPLTHSADIGHN